LAFELENRGYFALPISDWGDEYFRNFNKRALRNWAGCDGGL